MSVTASRSEVADVVDALRDEIESFLFYSLDLGTGDDSHPDNTLQEGELKTLETAVLSILTARKVSIVDEVEEDSETGDESDDAEDEDEEEGESA